MSSPRVNRILRQRSSRGFVCFLLGIMIGGGIGYVVGTWVCHTSPGKARTARTAQEQAQPTAVRTAQKQPQPSAARKEGREWALGVVETLFGIDFDKLKETIAAQKREAEAHTIRVGESVTIGSLRITALSVSLRKVTGTRQELFDERTPWESKTEMLVLKCRLKNVSEGQVFDPIGWRCSHDVKDEFGNEMRSFEPGGWELAEYSLNGYTEGDLKPGEQYDTIIVAHPPKVENAREFTWCIGLQISNDLSFPDWHERAIVKFNRSEIR